MSDKHWNGGAAASATRAPKLPGAASQRAEKQTGKTEEEIRAALSQYREILSASDAYYGEELAALDREKSDAVRRAAVNQALLQRYLPTTKAGAGLDGTGMGGSAATEANNAYQRALGKIESAYLAGKGKLQGERADNRDSLISYYGKLLRDDQEQLYQNTLDQIKGERFMGHAELQKILDNVKGLLRPEQYAHLSNLAGYYLSHPAFE